MRWNKKVATTDTHQLRYGIVDGRDRSTTVPSCIPWIWIVMVVRVGVCAWCEEVKVYFSSWSLQNKLRHKSYNFIQNLCFEHFFKLLIDFVYCQFHVRYILYALVLIYRFTNSVAVAHRIAHKTNTNTKARLSSPSYTVYNGE